MRTTADRFWRQVRVGNGCWLWKGSTFTPKGYGAFHVSDKVGTVSAHRFSYELCNGPIKNGEWVLHKCNVRSCVNPSHLYLGDAKDNANDRKKAGTQVFGSKTGTAKLDESKVSRIKTFLRYGLSVKKIAIEFSVKPSTVGEIKAGRIWRRVP